VDEVFAGLMGNWLAIEPMLATGAVDVLAMEENCSPPAIDSYAEKYQVALVAISTIIGVPRIQERIPYDPKKADEVSERLINTGIENFKKRHNKVQPHVPKRIQKAIAAFQPKPFWALLEQA
jgi:carbon-monoxide dehydrogenase catalytic subunit